MMKDVVVAGPVHTAIGTFGSALKAMGPRELLQSVLGEVIARNKIDKKWVSKVIIGNNMAPLDQNIARFAAYREGFPETTTGFTINSTCGSPVQALISAVQSIQCGETNNEYREAKYAAPTILKRLVSLGHLGLKSGRGFYDWSDRKRPVGVKF